MAVSICLGSIRRRWSVSAASKSMSLGAPVTRMGVGGMGRRDMAVAGQSLLPRKMSIFVLFHHWMTLKAMPSNEGGIGVHKGSVSNCCCATIATPEAQPVKSGTKGGRPGSGWALKAHKRPKGLLAHAPSKPVRFRRIMSARACKRTLTRTRHTGGRSCPSGRTLARDDLAWCCVHPWLLSFFRPFRLSGALIV